MPAERRARRYRGRVSTPRDDDALSWDGDDDPTLDVRGEQTPPRPPAAVEPEPPIPSPPPPSSADERSAPEASTPSPRTRLPDAAPETPPADDEARDGRGSGAMGNAGLVGVGMVAATFLLFAVGWLVAGLRLLDAGLPVDDVALIALTIGSALAPPVWFVATLALTRRTATWLRFVVLIVGIVLLVPWPYLSTGALV